MKKRIAAEWEPAIGVMVAWPASLPRALVRELASDTQLYLLCADDDAVVAEAHETLERWGIDAEGVRYLRVPKGEDSTWPRDWGPQPLFDADGTFKLLGPRYVYSTPFCGPEHDAPLTCAPWLDEPLSLDQYECDGCEDAAAGEIARQLGVEFVKLPFAFTGGNVLTDGIDSILSTEVLLLENKFDGLSVEEYFDAVAEVTGMANYSVFSDYEDYSLQHVDCFLKVLDDHRLLVQRPPADHPLFERYERIVREEIACAVNSYGKPWEILRVDTGVLADGESMAAYVNSLILNTCVYVPQYGIPEDEQALEQWRAAMPGYDVKGFTFVLDDEPEAYNPDGLYEGIGWDPGDVLHCRTRAVWDPGMLHIHVDTLDKEVPAADAHVLHVTIKAYSGEALLPESLQAFYRVRGEEAWQSVPLAATSTREVYCAELPGGPSGTAYEYYVAAADASGRSETMPRTAPAGFYTFAIQ